MSGIAGKAEPALEAERRRQDGDCSAEEALRGGAGGVPAAPPQPRPGAGDQPDKAAP